MVYSAGSSVVASLTKESAVKAREAAASTVGASSETSRRAVKMVAESGLLIE
jgi:hypothetical protein